MFPGQHTHTKISASRASTRKRTHMLSEYPHLQKHTHTRTQLQIHWFMDVAVNICIYVCIYSTYPQTFRQEVVMTASAKLAHIRWQKMWQHCMIHLRKIGVWLWKNKKTSNNLCAINETWRKIEFIFAKVQVWNETLGRLLSHYWIEGAPILLRTYDIS